MERAAKMTPLAVLVMACLHFGGVCRASPMPQVVKLLVEHGGTATLPCNGSAYMEEGASLGEEEEEGGSFRWEAMGADMVVFQGGKLIEGWGYEGRVQLAPDEKLREGDWSLVLEKVQLSDATLYECLMEGRGTVSTVWLDVKKPNPDRSLQVWLGDSLDLPCYTQIPKGQSLQDLQVWWARDGVILAYLNEGTTEIDDGDPSRFTLWNPENMEDFSLIIGPVLIHDHGEYRCYYRTSSSEDPKPGIPESITVTVLGAESTYNETISEIWKETENWTSILTLTETEMTTETGTQSQTEAGTTELHPDPTPQFLEVFTQSKQVATTSRPMEAREETATSFPEEGTFESWLETLPWVRVGLIAGVLVVTAVALCVLQAQRKI